MTSPSLDTSMMTRLALIRLLFQQGTEQAAQPEPLSYFSLLSLHDSVELFLVRAVDHLNAPCPAVALTPWSTGRFSAAGMISRLAST